MTFVAKNLFLISKIKQQLKKQKNYERTIIQNQGKFPLRTNHAKGNSAQTKNRRARKQSPFNKLSIVKFLRKNMQVSPSNITLR